MKEVKLFLKHEPKDDKWKVLVELPSGDAFIHEHKSAVVAVSQATIRALEDWPC